MKTEKLTSALRPRQNENGTMHTSNNHKDSLPSASYTQ